jgi:hypothetical protein
MFTTRAKGARPSKARMPAGRQRVDLAIAHQRCRPVSRPATTAPGQGPPKAVPCPENVASPPRATKAPAKRLKPSAQGYVSLALRMRLARTMCTTPMVSVIFIIVSTSFRCRTLSPGKAAFRRRNHAEIAARGDTKRGCRDHQPHGHAQDAPLKGDPVRSASRSRYKHDQHQQAVAGIGHDHAEEDDKGYVDDTDGSQSRYPGVW